MNDSTKPITDSAPYLTFYSDWIRMVVYTMNTHIVSANEANELLRSQDHDTLQSVWFDLGLPSAPSKERVAAMYEAFFLAQNGYVRGAPYSSFTNMEELIKQHSQGLITVGELILGLQLHPLQVSAIRQHKSLPYPVQAQVSLRHWDEIVAQAIFAGDQPKPESN